MLGQKKGFFFCLCFAIVSLSTISYYVKTNKSKIQHINSLKLNPLGKTSISVVQSVLSTQVQNHSAPSLTSPLNNTGNDRTVKTSFEYIFNSSVNDTVIHPSIVTKLNDSTSLKERTEEVKSVKETTVRPVIINSDRFDNVTLGHPKLQDSKSTKTTLRKSTIPDQLYTHHGYISVLDHTTKLNLHCTQCAYVSSSGQLLDSGIGYLIDEADCVFRMNDAPASGYEEDVGTRTTVRVMAHSSTPNLRRKHRYLVSEPSPTRFVVGWGPAKPMMTTGRGYAYNHLKETAKLYKNVDFFYLTQAQMGKADELFEAETGRPRMKSGTYLSTGWFTMLLARQSCDEIHIYGMVNDDYCQQATSKNVPYHYYDSRGRKECDYYKAQENGKKMVHRFMTEKAIFARWALEQPPMYFHNPNWNPE